MISRTSAATLVLVLSLVPGVATAIQLPVRTSPDEAACDPKKAPHYEGLLLDVIVNDTHPGLETLFLQRPCGAVLARQADLEALRIMTQGKPFVTIDGEKYLDLNAFDGMVYQLVPQQQRIKIEGEPRIFYPTIVDLDRARLPPAPAAPFGAFLNYSLSTTGNEGYVGAGGNSISGVAGLGIFGAPGVLTSDWLGTRFAGQSRIDRLGTTFTRDLEASRSTLRLGDVYARPGTFGSGAPLGGIQYGTNFALQPGLNTSPVQMMEAATRRAALVDLSSYDPNNPDRNSRAVLYSGINGVPHGPVELVNVPSYDNGQYQFVLRDSLGRETMVQQEFFFNQGLLRPGLDDFSYEAGVLRTGRGDHYRGAFASATRRWGLSNWLTSEVHGEASNHGVAAGGGGALLVPGWGVLTATAAGSNSDLASGLGAFGALGLENRYQRSAYAARVDCRDSRFHLPNETVSAMNSGCREFAFVSRNLPWRRDSVSVTVSNVSRPVGSDIETVRLSYITRLLKAATLQAFAGWTHSDAGGFDVGMVFDLPFGPNGVSVPGNLFDANRTSGTLLANSNFKGANSAFGRVATGAGNQDMSYGVQVGAALDDRDQQSLSGGLESRLAIANASVAKASGRSSYTVGAASALAFLDGSVFASRPLYASFALVRLGEEHGGLRVNGVHSNSNGDLLVTPLQPYAENLVGLNGADLPVNARVKDLQYTVRPRYRSGVVLKPTIETARDALLTVQVAGNDGQRVPLPPGSYATVPGVTEIFPVGEDGLIYVAGLDESAVVTIHYDDRECRLHLELPARPEPNSTPDLGIQFCDGARP